MNFIDRFLNSISMYRLVLYSLLLLSAIGLIFGFTKVLPLNGYYMLASLVVLFIVSKLSNQLLAKIFKIPANSESAYITALILFLILPPPENLNAYLGLSLAVIWAMAGKYIIAIKGKHIFNPAALGAFLASLTGSLAATWWIGSSALTPFVLIVGLLIVKKIRRFSLLFSFLLTATASITIVGAINGQPILEQIKEAYISWPILFFGTVMLTEPLTSPPYKRLQILFGGIAGILIGIPFSFHPFYNTPELTLIIANLFSFIVSPKTKLFLKFKEKIQIGPNIFNFIFTPNKPLKFLPGQYLEWTVYEKNSDSRGNRRYFTIASSPTEKEIHLGVKIPHKHSSLKSTLKNLQKNDEIVAGQLSGEFVLPKNKNEKIVGIAGGIGITPFRSMAKYLIDTNQTYDIVLFYQSLLAEEFAYKEIFKQAESIGLKTTFIISDPKTAPNNWTGKTGHLTQEILTTDVPDYKDRLFYLSGPNTMVKSYKKLLKTLGISSNRIITDYFPGY